MEAAQSSIDEAMQAGLVRQQAGQFSQAEAIYLDVLKRRPDHAPALHLLGITYLQTGRPELAADRLGRAVAQMPGNAVCWANLGEAFRCQKQFFQSETALGRAIALKPDLAMAHNNLANLLMDQGRFEEAIESYKAAIRFDPRYAAAQNNLGNAFRCQQKLPEAIDAYRAAIRLQPGFFQAHHNLGIALSAQRKFDAAVVAFREARRFAPGDADILNNLGVALANQGDLDQAIETYLNATRLRPDFAEAWNNLGVAEMNRGCIDESLAAFQRAIDLRPANPAFLSNRIYTLQFHPAITPQKLFEEELRWNEIHAQPLAQFIRPHRNDRNPKRRLRIGYVSPDFREHPVGRFVLPLMENHDHERFEVFCYSDVTFADAMTARFRELADVWRDLGDRSNEQAAELIRADQIDILIDLTMHMAHNRLPVFARKPAPVQASWLAYPGSTGLDAMDHRITDAYLDPPGDHDAYYSEKSIYLADSSCCYKPPPDCPEVSRLPALTAGYITFGCLNNVCKINQQTLTCWWRILSAVPTSRLLLHAPPGSAQERVRVSARNAGIEPDRIEFSPRVPMAEYLRLYFRIDIGLDPFPYSGGTTTCDALWMGVPVVTLPGQTAASRGGAMLLSNLRLESLITQSSDQYVQTALELAGDQPRLKKLREILRLQMKDSSLCDAAGFAEKMEAAYREMWTQCWNR